MKYLGTKESLFLFERSTDFEVIRFHHVRSDLIYHYDLLSERFVNKLFNVNFFISNHDDRVSRIISDLEIQDDLMSPEK